MRRRAVVVTLLALIVTLAPIAVVADHSQLVVASQFNTDTELAAAETLDNLTVSGSGSGAFVGLDTVADGNSDIAYIDTDGEVAFVDDAGQIQETGVSANEVSLAGDVDGDGDLDVPIRDASNNLVIVDSAGNTQTLVSGDSVIGLGGVADFDGDSDLDVFYRNSSSDMKYVDSSGNIVDTGAEAADIGGVANFDGDSDLDVAYRQSGDNALRYRDDSGNDAAAGKTVARVGPIVDADDDADLDIVYTTSSGNGLQAVDDSGNTIDYGQTADIQTGLGAGDIDGDGDVDVAYQTGSDVLHYVDSAGTDTNTGVSVADNRAVGGVEDFAAAAHSAIYLGQNHTVENAEQANVNLTLDNASAAVTITDPVSETTIGSGTFTSTGNKTISLSGQTSSKAQTNVSLTSQSGTPTFELHDESILFTATAPAVDNATAAPTGDLSAFQNTYTIDVSDADFPLAQGDSVTAELFIDGSSEGTDTLTSNGTASVTATTNTGGTHTYNWTVTDSYGLSHTSQDFEVRTPATIEIFNETSPQTKITGQGDITVRSFAEDTVIENTTSNGEVDMTGFPVDQEFVVKVSLDTYHDTTVIFDDIYQQQKIWLLNSSLDTNQVRFTLTDNTGDFQDDPKLLIERPLNHTGDNTTWEIIRADEFGAAGFTTNLETDTRYRLTVEAVDGATRSVGPFTSSIDETVPLTIGSGRLNLTTGADSYTFNATYENVSGTEQIRWGFADPGGLTTDLNVTIYEYQNASNRIYSQTFSDPSDLIATQMLTGNQPNLTWTVDWEATRDGETVGGQITVGRFINEQASALPAWLQEAVAIVVLMLTAGAFSQRNFAAGAVVVALMGGVFWMGGWLTGVTSGAGIAGALALAVLYKWARDVR